MSRIERSLGCLDHLVHGNSRNDDFHLYLRYQCRVNDSASVALGRTFLNAAAHNLIHCHAGDAELVERFLELIKSRKPADDGNLVHTCIVTADRYRSLLRRSFRRAVNLDRGILAEIFRLVIIALAKIRVFVRVDFHLCYIGNREAGVRACKTVLMNIQTINFNLCRNTKSDELVNDLESNKHRNQNIRVNCDNAEYLNAELPEAAAVEESLSYAVRAGGKQADRQCSPDAVDHVNRNRADRIIDLRDVIKELNRKNDNETGNHTDEECAGRRYAVASCRNRYKARERRVEGHRYVRLAVLEPGKDHSDNGCDSRCEVCCHESIGSGNRIVRRVHRDRRAAVETKPAEPQNEYAECHRGQVMAGNRSCLAVLVVLADSGAKHPRAEAGDHTADIVNNRGASEIMHTKRRKPAAAPYPVSFNRVYDQRNHRGIDAVGFEVCALCHGPRNDCRCRRAENRFENDKTP